MSEPKQCRSVLASAHETVVLGFELVGATAQNLPDLIWQALGSSQVQKAIRSALDEEAQRLLREHPEARFGETVPQDASQAQAFAKRLGERAVDAVESKVLSEVESSPEAKKLRKAAEQLLHDFDCSAMGVWVNQNRTWLYIVGGVLAVAGGAAMYIARWGDPAGQLVQGKAIQFNLGKLSLSGQLSRFEPSSRTVGAEITLSTDWTPAPTGSQRGQARLTIAGLASGSNRKASADGQAVIPLGHHVSGVLSARLDLRDDLERGPTGTSTPRLLTLSPSLGLRMSDQGLSVNILTGFHYDIIAPGTSPAFNPFAGLSLGLDRRLGPVRTQFSADVQLSTNGRPGAPGFERSRLPGPIATDPPANHPGAAFQMGATLKLLF